MEAEGGKAVDGKEATVKLLVECFLECREGKEEKTVSLKGLAGPSGLM